MRRRDFIAFVGGAEAFPFAARARAVPHRVSIRGLWDGAFCHLAASGGAGLRPCRARGGKRPSCCHSLAVTLVFVRSTYSSVPVRRLIYFVSP
jgi:hypothetical protein